MSVLTVTNVPDEIFAELARRAAAHGGTVEDEARRVLATALPAPAGAIRRKNEAILTALASCPEIGAEWDWIFDRHDPRHARPARAPLDLSA